MIGQLLFRRGVLLRVNHIVCNNKSLWRVYLFVEGCDIRIPDERLGSLMKLVNPEAFANHNLKERVDLRKTDGTDNKHKTSCTAAM